MPPAMSQACQFSFICNGVLSSCFVLLNCVARMTLVHSGKTCRAYGSMRRDSMRRACSTIARVDSRCPRSPHAGFHFGVVAGGAFLFETD
jgi:hypothetical protein